MNKFLTYAIEKETGIVLSRMHNGSGFSIAYPVLQYEKIGMGGGGFEKGDFNGPAEWALEKMPVYALTRWADYKWTKKIPVEIKNKHRAFWGFKPLPARKSD